MITDIYFFIFLVTVQLIYSRVNISIKVKITMDNKEVAKYSDVIVLSVKPNVYADVLKRLEIH